MILCFISYSHTLVVYKCNISILSVIAGYLCKAPPQVPKSCVTMEEPTIATLVGTSLVLVRLVGSSD
jgi:hypothetical protein